MPVQMYCFKRIQI